MSIKIYKPTTPSRRKTSVIDYKKYLTTSTPEKSLLMRKKKHSGRSRGTITVRHKGGGARKQIRIVNYKRDFPEGFKVVSVEYDPGRTAFISLVTDMKSGKKAYVLNSKGMKVGDVYGTDNAIVEGNHLKLKELPVGTEISQIEINPGQGAKMVRGAGTYAVVTARDGKFVTIKLPSSELRKI